MFLSLLRIGQLNNLKKLWQISALLLPLCFLSIQSELNLISNRLSGISCFNYSANDLWPELSIFLLFSMFWRLTWDKSDIKGKFGYFSFVRLMSSFSVAHFLPISFLLDLFSKWYLVAFLAGQSEGRLRIAQVTSISFQWLLLIMVLFQ